MAFNETTSHRVASIAARGLRDPSSLTLDEIQEVCGSALTQAPDNALLLAARYAYRPRENALLTLATILRGG